VGILDRAKPKALSRRAKLDFFMVNRSSREAAEWDSPARKVPG
jgi:hypothetical protein